MKLGNIDFVNPFNENLKYAYSFFLECGDLILPKIYNDYNCIWEGPYEYNNVKMKKSDIVIDCGSDTGLFSTIASYYADKVYAFEPIDTTANYIKKNRKIKENVEVVPYCLGNYVGECSFYNDSFGTSSHIVDKEDENSVTVPITTIDEFVKEHKIKHIDFIKADIEGAERYMLQGAKETLRTMMPDLAICTYHLPDDKQVLEKIIREANPLYVIEHKFKKLYAYVPRKEKNI